MIRGKRHVWKVEVVRPDLGNFCGPAKCENRLNEIQAEGGIIQTVQAISHDDFMIVWFRWEDK